jgi:hypothetical protein
LVMATTAIGISTATVITTPIGGISGMGAGMCMASVRAGGGRTTMTNSCGYAVERMNN